MFLEILLQWCSNESRKPCLHATIFYHNYHRHQTIANIISEYSLNKIKTSHGVTIDWKIAMFSLELCMS